MSLEVNSYFEEPTTPADIPEGADFDMDGLKSKETENKTLDSEVPLSFSLGNREYRSLDENNPEIDISKSEQERLNSLVKKARESGSELMHIGEKLNQANETLENIPEENLKLQEILTKYFEENKDEIKEKLGIIDISDLTPAKATKLVSMLTMDKLEYNYSQQITPKTGEYYFKMLSPEEKKEFKMDLHTSSVVAALGQFEDHFKHFFIKGNAFNISTMQELGKEFYDGIRDGIDEEQLGKLSGQGLDEIREEAKLFVYDTMKQTYGITDEDISNLEKKAIINGWDDPASEVYIANSKLFNSESKFDRLTVSELLEGGKGVCRNYAVAQEKLFEALKGLQKEENNKLQNSALISYSGNTKGDDFNKKLADTEAFTNDHSWNTLITIGADGKEYISQIDSTLSDALGGNGKIETLDKTYDRLFNDIADNFQLIDLVDLDKKLEEYVTKLEKQNIDPNRIKLIKTKLVDLYKTFNDTKKA